MYLLNVIAIVAEEELIPVRPLHKAWLKTGFDKGYFMLAGPKTSEGGGFILAQAIDQDVLKAFIETDPFILQNVTKYVITAFTITMIAAGLESLQGNI